MELIFAYFLFFCLELCDYIDSSPPRIEVSACHTPSAYKAFEESLIQNWKFQVVSWHFISNFDCIDLIKLFLSQPV